MNPARRRRPVRTALVAVAGAVLLSSCTAQSGDGDEVASSSPEDTQEEAGAAEPPEEPEPACDPVDLDPVAVREAADGGTVAANDAVLAAFDCAEVVVVVPADDPALAAVGVPLAVAADAPLLLGDPDDLGDVLADLGDPEVRTLEREPRPAGDDEQDGDAADDGQDDAADDGQVDEQDADAPTDAVPAMQVAEELDTVRFVAAPADEANRLAAAAAVATRSDAAVLPVEPGAPAPDLPPDAEVVTVGDLGDSFPDAEPATDPWPLAEGADTAWVFDPADPAAPSAVATASLRGDGLVPISGGDLLARRNVARVRDAGLSASSLLPVGDLGDDPSLHVEQVAEAPLLPGGTLRLFDGTRMVAVYGHPGSAVLGVLGEQDLDATIERAREVSEGYDADGRTVIPTLEIIVTIASASAGEDGNYSNVNPPEQFQEWVDRAGEEGYQVILDLQPGRTDFLTQARIYEDLLREPHVGLALDPEWRLEPDQVHLRQIGGVDAAEVQEVVDWLAELTREEGQTQKLLVLHQFRHSMLRDRDTIEVPPEIAAVIHADGQGPQSMKLDTWRALTAGAEDRWLWGWKNFYDEDPVVAEPSYILDLAPDVVLVTYQ